MGEFASKGVAGTALGTGIAGLSLGVLNGMSGSGLLGGILGGNGACSDNTVVNRYELNLTQEIASKDARIGLLESQVYVDQKLTDIVKDYTSKINALSAQVQANKDEQYQVNLQQAVFNGTTTSTIACIQNQIAQLQSLTKLVVSNSSVCPGWGNVTITPATTTTTPAA